jgi:hypothetical protein
MTDIRSESIDPFRIYLPSGSKFGSPRPIKARQVSLMFKESSPIVYDAPADLKKWPSLKGQRLNGGRQPYLVFNGTLAECIRELLAKPVKQISLYDIETEPQPIFDSPTLSPGDAAEIAMRKDFPKD